MDAYGHLTTPADDPLSERLGALWEDLTELLADLRPDVVVVERVLFQVNARTAMSVGQASGLALAAAARAGCPVAQYSPNEVKLAVAGYGGGGQGAGAAHGAGAARPGRSAPTGGPGRRPGPGRLPPVRRRAAGRAPQEARP